MALQTLQTVELQRAVKGAVVLPGDPAYDEVRTVWNAMVDRRPALIVRCAIADDVPPALAFARQHGLPVAVRGGGHNIAGFATCDTGLVIDLSPMTGVTVDPVGRRAQVQGGATLADVDAVTQAYGLATPLGINSTTGVAGLTLGGGFGWLTRRWGMTIDNLLSADLVTADGRQVRVSDRDHPELFWAIRGGGGNFGVVTRFEFALHPVGPEVAAGLLLFPFEDAHQVLRLYREYMSIAPEALNVWAVLRQAPPLPFLPPEAHGRKVVALAVFYAGDPFDGEHHIAQLRGFADPYGELVTLQRYTMWQQAFDSLLAPGARNYWKSHNLTDLTDAVLDRIMTLADELPSPQSEIFVGLVAGAANRVPAPATAYANRETRFVMNVHARWPTREEDGRCIDWARRVFEATAPYASAGGYVNFMTEDETDRVAAAYGRNYSRLVEIKRTYDPENVFRLNQNIRP